MISDRQDVRLMDSFYPCIKYKKPADPKLDGTDYFIVAESMYFKQLTKLKINGFDVFDCSLSFTCENDKQAFYQLVKDCLRSKSKENKVFRKYPCSV